MFKGKVMFLTIQTFFFVNSMIYTAVKDKGLWLEEPFSLARAKVKLRLNLLMHCDLHNKDSDKTLHPCAHTSRQ